MRTIMFISLVIAMVLIPANTATANEFMQNRKEYETAVNYRDDERRGLDVGVTPATLVREVVAGTPSIMGG